MNRDVPPPAARGGDLAAWARIAVKYADRAAPMPLVRLDRDGLTVAIADDVHPLIIGLPRRALIVCDSMPLCEIRLVARAASREQGRAMTVTLQPSRANDHAQLWQALRTYQTQWTASPSASDNRSERLPQFAPSAVSRQPHEESAQDNARWETDACNDETDLPTATVVGLRGFVSCDAAFSLARCDDAWLFASWLDYHFAEVRARARMSGAAADLRDIFMRVVDQEVKVRFLFRSMEQVVQTSTELACRWIAVEAARQLEMTVEHWTYGTPAAFGSRTLPVRADRHGRAGGGLFLSV